MGKKYIAELGRCEGLYKSYFNGDGKPNLTWLSPEVDLTPYIEPDLEQVRKEAYQKGVQDTKQHWADFPRTCAYKLGYENGLNDAWDAARKIAHCFLWGKYQRETGRSSVCAQDVLEHYSAQEAIEEIRAHEQAQREKEEQEEKDSVTAEEVMRQYLDRFCKSSRCGECVLHTSDFTCGRGHHFLTKSRVSDEEVRRAYATVLAKMKE